jgi:hypothetical protein
LNFPTLPERERKREMSVLTMDTLLATLRGATDAQWLAFMQLQNERGFPLFHAAEEEKEAAAAAAAAKVAARKMTAEAKAAAKAAKAEEKAAAKAAKAEEKAEEKAAAKAAKAEAKAEAKIAAKAAKAEAKKIAAKAAPASAPASSEYRIPVWDIDTAVCIGRSFKDGKDKRWKPIIYRESQCGGKLVEGSDICTKCASREQKAIAEPEKAAKIGWLGRMTEEPYDWSHMLGTAWAEKKKPVFSPDTGCSTSEDETGIVSDAMTVPE